MFKSVLILLLLPIAGWAQSPGDSAMPTPITWEALTSKLDMERFLPQPLPTDLVYKKKALPDLVPLMKGLAARKFDGEEFEASEAWLQSFGDIMAAFHELRRNRAGTEIKLKALERVAPKIRAELEPYLSGMVKSHYLYGLKWRPTDDHEQDGMFTVKPWRLNPHSTRSRYWNENKGNRKVFQCATFIYADFATIRGVALDYAGYGKHVDRDLEWIRPRRGTFFIAAEGEEFSFSSLEIEFEGDLPFPFGTVVCRMKIVDRIASDGIPYSEYYVDGEDFYWFTGRDTFIPVRTSSDEFVGCIVVGQLLVDVESVPDTDSHRERLAGLRRRSTLSEAHRVTRRANPPAPTHAQANSKQPRPTWARDKKSSFPASIHSIQDLNGEPCPHLFLLFVGGSGMVELGWRVESGWAGWVRGRICGARDLLARWQASSRSEAAKPASASPTSRPSA